MFKNKLNYKLINIAIVALIIFLMYQTGNLWIGVFNKILKITLPFLFAFAIAYAIHPFLKKLEDNKVPKWLGMTLIVLLIFIVVGLFVFLVSTVFISQLSNLFDSIIEFIKTIDTSKFDINFVDLEDTLSTSFDSLLSGLGTYISNGAINIFNTSISLISNILVCFAAFIYFLKDMDKIREYIKNFFSKRSKKTYNYVRTLDHEMKNYLSGLVQVIFITLVEYTLGYTIIGHPSALLLGFLAAVACLIPYFGGICVNIIAAITAFVVSPALFIRTIIAFTVLSTIDGYVINPTVYGKTNKIHPILTIIALFAGSIIFGILGFFIAFPLTILLLATIKYYKKDIKEKIDDIKEDKKKD